LVNQAWESAQRLAIDAIEYPADKRHEVMRRMGTLLTEVAREKPAAHMGWRLILATQWSTPS
jgi:acetyl-CoA carboxylase carboxyltransferase component